MYLTIVHNSKIHKIYEYSQTQRVIVRMTEPVTRSQAVARIADRTASRQIIYYAEPLVESHVLKFKSRAHNCIQ